jgi:hypothetical protein
MNLKLGHIKRIFNIINKLDNETIIKFRNYLLDEQIYFNTQLEVYAVQVEYNDFQITFFNKDELEKTIEFLNNKIQKSFEEEVKEFTKQSKGMAKRFYGK